MANVHKFADQNLHFKTNLFSQPNQVIIIYLSSLLEKKKGKQETDLKLDNGTKLIRFILMNK